MGTKSWIIRDNIGQLLLLGCSILAWFQQWTVGMLISLGIVLLWQWLSAGLWSAWHPYSFRRPWIKRAVIALFLWALALLPDLRLLMVFPFLEALIYLTRSLRDLRRVLRAHRSFWDMG